MTSTIVYHVRPGNPVLQTFTVTCLVPRPAPDGQRLSLPAWIPGSYLVRDYARHVLSVSAESEGRELAVTKLDKSTWQVEPVDGPLQVRAEIHADDGSVRGAFLDARSGFFNGVALLFQVQGREAERCVLHVDPPAGDRRARDWRLVTSLRRLTGNAHEFGAFTAEGYADLIDHPVLMGELAIGSFDAGGVPHEIAIEGAQQADLPRLCADLSRLCTWQQQFWGLPADLRRYVFLLRLVPSGMGGLEHCHSSALAADRDSLPAPGTGRPGEAYRRFLGLASHEYFHLWHVKRIRPAELAGADLAREAYTRQLWIFEGITSYYDDLALLRCGLVDREAWLEVAGQVLTRVYRSPGRRRQTLEEASFDAWIKFYRPDASSPNHTISYYAKGALVALALDLEIRLRSDGRCSLDEVMRALWLRHGASGAAPLPPGGFERLAEDVSGCALGDFFDQAVRGTQDWPLGILLARFGILLHTRAAEGRSDRGGRPARQPPAGWLGLDVAGSRAGVRIRLAWSGGPGERAGLRAGDELVALDGRRLSADNHERLLAAVPPGTALRLDAFRGDELLAFELVAAAAPKTTCWLEPDPAADAAAVARRIAWLGS
jgi:predicted metalloprotease with PDZ domain